VESWVASHGSRVEPPGRDPLRGIGPDRRRLALKPGH
jgi:hypothetical protein